MRTQVAGIVVLMVSMFGCGSDETTSAGAGAAQTNDGRKLSDVTQEVNSTLEQAEQDTGIRIARGDPPASEQRTAEALKALGCDYLADSEGKINSIIVYEFTESPDSALEKLAKLDGLNSLKHLVFYDERITDAGIRHVGKLRSITYLALPPKITADGFEKLKTLNHLSALAFNFGIITDEVVNHITSFKELQTLALSPSNISDDQLKSIASLNKLEYLVLDGTPISDTGLQYLKDCKSLKRVSVERTQVTVEGVEQLKKAIPGVEVLR